MFLLLLLLLGACGGIAARVEDATVSDDYQPSKRNENCVQNTMEMCRDLPYNETILPNLLRHTKLEEAEAELNQFKTLVSVKCSPDIKLFLCTMYSPVCTILPRPVPPCRHLCQSAKDGCESLMVKFGYSWPEIFNCDKFPENGMCVGENRTTPAPEPRPPTHHQRAPEGAPVELSDELECPHTMKVLSRTRYSLLIANSTIEQCSLPCQNDGVVPTFFNAHTRNYLRLWTGVWAVACCVGTLFTIISFLIDLERFQFPERAIFYMSLCYLAVSCTYIAGMVAEDGLSCSGMSATKQQLVSQGVDNFACTAMAVAHYYFTTAGIIWWVILSFAWFLVTTLKWGEQPVGEMFASYFNIFAWGVPCIMTIAVLITHNVDGDLLTGVCSVGNLRPSALFNFVVVPQSILITIGLVLFVCGFISIMRIRSYIKGHTLSKFEVQEASADKVSRLMLRISLFAAIYIVPTVVGALCTFYQAVNMENWLTNWYSTRCLHAQRGTFGFTQAREMCPIDANAVVNGKPEPIFFFLRYASFFTVGIACGIWTANGKTFNSFRELYIRVFHGRSRVPTRVH